MQSLLAIVRRRPLALLLAGALALAVVGARDRIGGWNDGSRLATVECLIDYHTLAIDQSMYLQPAGPESVRLATDPGAVPVRDRLLIAGHFYSDKTPVPAVFLALLYQVWSWATGLAAHDWPPGFVYTLTLGSSVAAYGLTLVVVAGLFRRLGLPDRDICLLTASLALATVAPIYALQINNHILLLAVAALVLSACTRLAAVERPSVGLLIGLGGTLGLGYTVDQGVGPMLLLTTAPLVLYRCRAGGRWAVVALAACPWLLLHHALNYAIGGSWRPANAIPEYFQWDGCPFNAQNMTGVCTHPTVAEGLSYTTKMLLGKQGYVGHDLALWLLPPACWVLIRRRVKEWPEATFALAWIVGTIGLYAWLSRNYGGECRSIRWFVPLLAPAYYLLALLVREAPRCRADLAILSGWGALVIATRWQAGPWDMQVGKWYWPLETAALTTWLAWNLARLVRGDWTRSVFGAVGKMLRDYSHPETAVPGLCTPKRTSR